MVTFLTSSFIKYENFILRKPDKGDDIYLNGFVDKLLEYWRKNTKLLFIASDPDDHIEMDFRSEEVYEVFMEAGLPVKEMRVLDHRTGTSAAKLIAWADVIFLAGGHAPTELKFFNEIGLRELIKGFDGILIGLSAGSVNMADIAYMPPELDGEAIDPNYIRFLPGLNLTTLQILPHRDYLRNAVIDGKRYMEDIVLPDSYGRRFYMITDGSFFSIENGVTRFYGSGDIISNGLVTQLKEGVIMPFSCYIDSNVWHTFAKDVYDTAFKLNIRTLVCTFYFINDRILMLAESNRYPEIMKAFSTRLVEDEISDFIAQTELKKMIDEVKERGSFVRTIHVQNPVDRLAKIMRVNPIPGNEEEYLITFFDVSSSLDHDWMTDELSRTGFIDRATNFMKAGTREESYSLVYSNIRGFKAVNELFNEQSGDMVIFQTRDELRKYLKPYIMGRLESDHFVMIVNDRYLDRNNLKKLCRQTYLYEYKEYHFDIHLGIYHITDRNTAIPHMIDRAKLAEKSVETGRNKYYSEFNEVVKERYVRQQMLLSEMKEALGSGEFIPFFQPIVDAGTAEIVSAEALIRWKHRALGMVSPGDFIPAIENAGKISALDRFMFNSVFDIAKKRADEGARIVPCAVNLSRIDFYDPKLMELIQERIDSTENASDLIRVEVTESAYADLEQNAVGYLDRMKKAGIKILLDDYGSGMSSLSTLENFEFDIVKLDIGFIRKIGIHAKAETIIESTIKLSHALGATVTAEGVENETQLKFLRDCGCDYIQGYYFYKPMAPEEFLTVLNG